MHNVLFVLTHTGADIRSFWDAMQAANPNVRVFDTRFEYQSYDDLQYLRRMPHTGSASAIWVDILRNNQSLNRLLLDHVDVIGYISRTVECEKLLKEAYGERADDYYTNRLMGIKDFATRKNAKVLIEPSEESPWLVKLCETYFPEAELS